MLEFYLKLNLLLSLILVGSLHWENGSVVPFCIFSLKGFSSLLLHRLPLAALKVEIGDRKVLLYWHQRHLALVSTGLCRYLKLSSFPLMETSWRLLCLAALIVAPLTSANWACGTPVSFCISQCSSRLFLLMLPVRFSGKSLELS